MSKTPCFAADAFGAARAAAAHWWKGAPWRERRAHKELQDTFEEKQLVRKILKPVARHLALGGARVPCWQRDTDMRSKMSAAAQRKTGEGNFEEI
jgi:hypothetical protein